MSDIIAQIAVGMQNSYFQTSYISKNKWDDLYLKKSLNDKSYGYDETMDFREPETYELQKKGSGITKIFTIEHTKKDTYEISDLRLRVKLTDFNSSIRNSTLNWIAELYIGGALVNRMDMITNLFLCKAMKKHIKETDEELIIPLILFDLSSCDKFPIYLMGMHEVSIRICTRDEPFELSMFVEKYYIDAEPKKYKKLTSAICQTQLWNFENNNELKNIRFYHPSQFMYMVFNSDDIFTQPQISKIFLHLNNQEPIKWDTYLDEIIHIKVFDKIICIVSLISDIRTIKDIGKMFKEIKYNIVKTQNQIKFDIPAGINFSRIDKIKISFEFDDNDTSNVSGTIGIVNLNIQSFMHGMCGVAYV